MRNVSVLTIIPLGLFDLYPDHVLDRDYVVRVFGGIHGFDIVSLHGDPLQNFLGVKAPQHTSEGHIIGEAGGMCSSLTISKTSWRNPSALA